MSCVGGINLLKEPMNRCQRCGVDSHVKEVALLDSQEHASNFEMRFAGQYLNVVGLTLLGTAVLSYLKMIGVTQQAATSGFLHCSLGCLLAAFLLWGGDQAHRLGLRSYAQPMLAVGCSLLLLTLGAAHFYFHLLPAALFMLAVFGLTAGWGLASLHYDSPLMAVCLLGALFLGPTVMSFGLPLGLLCAYLLAINLATTAMAYRKRWDLFLVGSFFGTHSLYLSHSGLSHPGPTLLCLTITYLLFLVAAQLFDRNQEGRVHLWVSLANPLLFAFLSYAVLVRQPVALAVSLFLGLALIHMSLFRRGLAELNLSLCQLFALASTSFFTDYPVVVTSLWLAQAFAALWAHRRLSPALAPLARRGSYFALGLAAFHLLYVVPTMATAYWLQIPAAIAMLGYFALHTRPQADREELLMSNLTLLLALATGSQSLVDLPFYWSLLVTSLLVPLLGLAVKHYPTTLQPWSPARPCLAGVVALGSWLLHVPPRLLPVMALAIATASPVGAAVILMRAALWTGPWCTLLWCLLGLALLRPLQSLGAGVFALAFLKSVALDVDFAHGPQGWELAGIRPWDATLVGVVVSFWVGARLARSRPELRQILLLYGQLVMVFQVSRWLYDVYAILENFQVILSAFWATTSVLFIGYGTYYQNRLFRLFGLALVVSCVVKMYAVDIWILNAYDQTSTTLVMGVLLMLVSYFYQFNRLRLTAPGGTCFRLGEAG